MLPISAWFYERRKILKLKFYEFETIQAFLPGLYDIQVNFVFDGEICEARAQAYNRNLAIEKACAEALERLPFSLKHKFKDQNVKTSSGFAAHSNYRSACVRARRELIERDIFMCNILTGAHFSEIEILRLRNLSSKMRRLPKKLAQIGVDLKLTKLHSDSGLQVVMCALFGDQHNPIFGMTIGLGIASNLIDAIEKAVHECMMVSFELLSGIQESAMNEKQFLNKRKIDFCDHRRLGLNSETASKYLALFSCDALPQKIKKLEEKVERAFLFERIALPEYFNSCPGFVVRATNPLFQSIILGRPTIKDVNVARINSFIRHFAGNELSLNLKNIHVLA